MEKYTAEELKELFKSGSIITEEIMFQLIDLGYTKEEVDKIVDNITAEQVGVYTKEEVNSKIKDAVDEIPVVDSYTKEEVDSKLSDKADVNTTYTKEEVDEKFTGLATKEELSTSLSSKADKTELDGLVTKEELINEVDDISAELDSKADKSLVYTKSEVDDKLSGISTADAYTKAETDAKLNTKANSADVTLEKTTRAAIEALIK